jgi:hypothetical protein
MASNLLQGHVICATGDFSSVNATIDSIRRWVSVHGGTYSKKVDENVNLLISTEYSFKRPHDDGKAVLRFMPRMTRFANASMKSVKRARELGIPIVTYDWLEDSLRGKKALKPSKKYFHKINKVLRAEGESSRCPDLRTRCPFLLPFAITYFYTIIAGRWFLEGCLKAEVDLRSGTSTAMVVYKDSSAKGKILKGRTAKRSAQPAKTVASRKKNKIMPATRSDESILLQAIQKLAESEDDDEEYVETESSKKRKRGPKPRARKTQNAKRNAPITGLLAASFSIPLKIRSPAERRAERLEYLDKYANKDWTILDQYHIYVSPTDDLRYDITLARFDFKKNTNERFQIRLYESNMAPYYYACHTRLIAKGIPTARVIVPIGSTFEKAYTGLKTAFLEKTGYNWEDRLTETRDGMHTVNAPPPVNARQTIKGPNGEEQCPFVYLYLKDPLLGMISKEAERAAAKEIRAERKQHDLIRDIQHLAEVEREDQYNAEDEADVMKEEKVEGEAEVNEEEEVEDMAETETEGGTETEQNEGDWASMTA